MRDGFEAEQEGRILPLLPLRSTQKPVPCREHRVPSVILTEEVAVPGTNTAGCRIEAMGRSEPIPVPGLSGMRLGPGYIAVSEV